MSYEPAPLQIPSNVLKNVKIQGKDTLAEKCKPLSPQATPPNQI